MIFKESSLYKTESFLNRFDKLYESESTYDARMVPIIESSEYQTNVLSIESLTSFSEENGISDLGKCFSIICESNNIDPYAISFSANEENIIANRYIRSIVESMINAGNDVYVKPISTNTVGYYLAEMAVDMLAYEGDNSLLEAYVTDDFESMRCILINESENEERFSLKDMEDFVKEHPLPQKYAKMVDEIRQNSELSGTLSAFRTAKLLQKHPEEVERIYEKTYKIIKSAPGVDIRDVSSRLYDEYEDMVKRDSKPASQPSTSAPTQQEPKPSASAPTQQEPPKTSAPAPTKQEPKPSEPAPTQQTAPKTSAPASTQQEPKPSEPAPTQQTVPKTSAPAPGSSAPQPTVPPPPNTQQTAPPPGSTEKAKELDQKATETVNQVEKEAEGKKKGWFASKIAWLRGLYKNWLAKANIEKDQKKIGFFKNIARTIMGAIDYLMKKLEGAKE